LSVTPSVEFGATYRTVQQLKPLKSEIPVRLPGTRDHEMYTAVKCIHHCMHKWRLDRESGATALTRTLRFSAPNCSHPPITFCRNLSEALVATRNASGLGSLASVCLSSSCLLGWSGVLHPMWLCVCCAAVRLRLRGTARRTSPSQHRTLARYTRKRSGPSFRVKVLFRRLRTQSTIYAPSLTQKYVFTLRFSHVVRAQYKLYMYDVANINMTGIQRTHVA
jgi:hypothetical protein